MAKRTRENGVKTTDYRHSQDHRPNIPPARIAGEAVTAQLLAKYGSKADVVRELAYRLYAACERRKRAKDAGSYNALFRVRALEEPRKSELKSAGPLVG